MLFLDDDSSEEVDVVSVIPSRLKDQKVLVLPATSSISERVAALHNYSSPHAPDGLPIANSVLCNRVTLSAPSSPSRQQQITKTNSISNPSSPASKRSVLLPKCSQLRHTRTARNSCVNSDSEDSTGSVFGGICRSYGGGKRSLHNVLERRRRSCLKVHFHLLRDVVPSVAGNCRMSKVAILKAAHSHMVLLKKEGLLLQAELNQLRSLNQRWQRKLALLSQ